MFDKSLSLHAYVPFILTLQFKKEDIYFDEADRIYVRICACYYESRPN